MGFHKIRTKKGYLLSEMASTLQKSIRRGDTKIAGFSALEMYESGYWRYLWKRLYTISAEDVSGLMTKEIHALFNGFLLQNEKQRSKMAKGRIFISKAVLLLCKFPKDRDADHIQNLTYDGLFGKGIDEAEIEKYIQDLEASENIEIPKYAFDCHTVAGKKLGKSKFDFFIDEFIDLHDRMPSLFEDEINELQNDRQKEEPDHFRI